MLNRAPLWKTVGIAVAVAVVVLGVVTTIVWATVARDRVSAPTPTPTATLPPTNVPPTATITLTGTPENTSTPIPPDAALGVVEDYTPGALIIVIAPIEGKVEQIIVPENLEVTWKDGSRASPREISPGQTIYAEGVLGSPGTACRQRHYDHRSRGRCHRDPHGQPNTAAIAHSRCARVGMAGTLLRQRYINRVSGART